MPRIIFSLETFEQWAKNLPVGFPCVRCTENCCTDYLIFVTHVDVARIHRMLPQLPLRDYLEVSQVEVDDYPEVTIAGRRGRLVIKKEPNTGRCVFLASGVNLCSIHTFSPYICQMYPFQVPFDDYRELELRQNIKCPERFLCPKADVQRLIGLARTFWQQDLPRYADLVDTWHRTRPGGTLEDFARFILHAR